MWTISVNKKSLTSLWLIGVIFYTTLLACSSWNPFFWDSILFSKIAQHYLSSHFASLVLPEWLDTGNPPLFPLYLASVWKVFGITLPVAHWAMWPFLLGIVYYYLQLAKRFVSPSGHPLALFFLLIQPTLLSQCTIVSVDIPILCFFLMGCYATFTRQKWLSCLAAIVLVSLSLRGLVLLGSIYIASLFYNRQYGIKAILTELLAYIPAVAILFAWLWYHKTVTGWATQQPNEWAEHRAILQPVDLAKNIVYFILRLNDFGQWFWWLLFAVTCCCYMWTYLPKKTIVVGGLTLLLLAISLLPFSLPIAHRYLMPISVWFMLALSDILLLYPLSKRVAILIAGMMCLCYSHFVFYPAPYANGWEACITHTRYFSARQKMITYLQQRSISTELIGADFPCDADLMYTDLAHQHCVLGSKKVSGIHHFQYLLYSNINNNFQRWELDELHQHWVLEKRIEQFPVFMELYRNPNY